MASVSSARRTGIFAALSALVAGCSPVRALDALVPRDSYRGDEGLAYGPDERHRLDTYLPLGGDAATPLVVFFYGGSWTRGSRADYRFVGEALASAGVATAIADYRLSPQVHWREILADCALATRWARDHAPRLGCAADRVYVMGHSAGAYNAAMLALDPRWLAAQQLRPADLAGWIGIAGPYDFLPIGDRDTQVAFGWPDTPVESQPIVHAGAGAPRTLLVAGGKDTVVSTQRSTVGLAERLKAARVPVQLRLYDELNHATSLGAMARPLRWMAPVREDVAAFVRTGHGGPA
ncbi:MAG: alpha/beta hydrolase [Comamonadaceae bacterium]|nr:MAG: alpha/beta hydrolase [Comamonadaceae bacterium]